jgi:Family of unknown function (DUF6221)
VDDLSAWLLEQISDDEREAAHLDSGWWEVDSDHSETYQAVMRFAGKDRVLAECEAKRKLIDRYKRAVAAAPSAVSSYVRGQDYGYREACLDAIQDEAAVYAAMGRPGYRKEWAPL